MASWKLCLLVVASTILALAMEADCNRRRQNRRRQYAVSEPEGDAAVPTTDEGDDNAVVSADTGRRGGRRRGGEGGAGGRRRGGGGGRRRGQSGRRPGGRRPGGRRPGRRPRPRPSGGRRGVRFDVNTMSPLEQQTELHSFARSINQFSVDMYGELASGHTDNFVFSPLSVLTAFSMLELGAGGATKNQIRNALSLPRQPRGQPLSNAFKVKLYSNSLPSDSTTRSKLANAIYLRPGFNPKRQYNQALTRFFDSSANEFLPTNPEVPINDWVETQTEGEIFDFLPDGFITNDTVMFLVNAIYFKGRWKDPFEESNTRFASFSVSDQMTHQVMMMSRDGDYKVYHSATLGASVLELPYEGNRYAFYIILPNQNTELSTVESRLTGDLLNSTLNMTSAQRLSRYDVTIPKFGLDTDEDLKPVLQALGVQDVFTDRANLRRMARRGSQNRLYVSQAKHRAVIELDEEGTVAAGATGIGIAELSLPPSFTADRPFAFVLRDTAKDVNLFVGRYSNPMGENLRV